MVLAVVTFGTPLGIIALVISLLCASARRYSSRRQDAEALQRLLSLDMDKRMRDYAQHPNFVEMLAQGDEPITEEHHRELVQRAHEEGTI